MSIVLDSPAVLSRFDDICSLVSADNSGITMVQLRTAHALARELESDSTDTERVKELAHELDIHDPQLLTPII